jgi:iron complex outermembrane receptor protein
MRTTFISLFFIYAHLFTQAQKNSSDTSITLTDVVVHGFESNRKLMATPASISILTQKFLQRFQNTTLVPAFNTIPGVRMEERSPGSYRLSIRGSLLRSPFGVRNVKIYFDDIPFTDAGGNTYINLIDPGTVNMAEILKGPASSLYGAGTGGAVLLNTAPLIAESPLQSINHHFKAQLQGGSYGLFSESAEWKMTKKNYGLKLTQSHMQSDGYRDNSKMRRDVIQFNDQWKISAKDEMKSILLLADLYYQTPGGLTWAQYLANPQQSRPATPTLPGAKEQKIAVYNKTIFTGLSNTYHFSDKLSNVTSVAFNYTQFKNPFITNYEKRRETSGGIRSKFIYATKLAERSLKLIAGGEWQNTFSYIDNFGNRKGVADTVQTKDQVGATQQFYFAQTEWDITNKITLTTVASLNRFVYRYVRTSDIPVLPKKTKQFDPVLSPRVALLYMPVKSLSFRASVSKGFSTPTIAEVRPSEGSFFESLQPEYGWNYETGVRTDLVQHRLQMDINVFQFNLKNTIVRRVASNGGEYFVNAGETQQKGLESYVAYQLIRNPLQYITSLRIWSSLTLNDFHFKDYKSGTADYSGKALTGVPATISVNGLDMETHTGFYFNLTFNYTSKLPLTDANSVYASDYHLLQAKAGYKHIFRNLTLEIFAGGDNLLNEKYSLGNDINAVGNRFYNAAPLRNYYGGIIFSF